MNNTRFLFSLVVLVISAQFAVAQHTINAKAALKHERIQEMQRQKVSEKKEKNAEKAVKKQRKSKPGLVGKTSEAKKEEPNIDKNRAVKPEKQSKVSKPTQRGRVKATALEIE